MLYRIINFITILCLIKISLISCSVNNHNNKNRKEEFPLSELAELDESNWRAMLDGEWMVEFFAPWCPACKSLAPTWEKFAISAANYNLHVGKIDVTKSPSLSGRFFVTALPTIYHVLNGEFRQYRGPRNGDSLLEYIREKQWKKVEPLSAWKQPNSVHMSILSWFFKLSHYLKDVNTRLHEEYGLPTWGSYLLFSIATIFIGAVLGLFLVCLVDFLYPPKKINRQSFSEDKLKDGTEKNLMGDGDDGIEYIPGDEIEDDNEEEEEEEEEGEEEEGKNKNENDNGDEDSTSEGEKISDQDDDEEDEANLELSKNEKLEDDTNLRARKINTSTKKKNDVETVNSKNNTD